MHRTVVAPPAPRFGVGMASAWITRRWYYTPKSHRAYSVRQISPGDRRLLAEFALALSRAAPEREAAAARAMASMLFDRVIVADLHGAVGFAALESTAAGDRVIGVAAYAPVEVGAEFCIAVANSYRDEQVGRTLLLALVRHARRVGITRLTGDMFWSNRPMQMLAMSTGFVVEPLPRDRNWRRLVLSLK
ncbi:MAG TPA: GNAT family N-acetyltransferase [Steroidobacteraceae bacterium]|nr:GNAT family N-acetyltransferase [Steroidobacteraceae bacterium]